MARKSLTRNWLGGGPGSKFALNNIKFGQGNAVVLVEQTQANMTQEEIDQARANQEHILNLTLRATALKLTRAIEEPEVLDRMRLGELFQGVIGAQQMVQALAGYTTKSARVPLDEVLGELQKVKEARSGLGEAIGQLMELRRAAEAKHEAILAEGVKAISAPVEAEYEEVTASAALSGVSGEQGAELGVGGGRRLRRL